MSTAQASWRDSDRDHNRALGRPAFAIQSTFARELAALLHARARAVADEATD
jgi:hypothetical protein